MRHCDCLLFGRHGSISSIYSAVEMAIFQKKGACYDETNLEKDFPAFQVNAFFVVIFLKRDILAVVLSEMKSEGKEAFYQERKERD